MEYQQKKIKRVRDLGLGEGRRKSHRYEITEYGKNDTIPWSCGGPALPEAGSGARGPAGNAKFLCVCFLFLLLLSLSFLFFFIF